MAEFYSATVRSTNRFRGPVLLRDSHGLLDAEFFRDLVSRQEPNPEFQREVQHPLLGVIPSWLLRPEGVLP